jgi:uncharacterized pyridoxal phosphate-containing UPF0001 family protein
MSTLDRIVNDSLTEPWAHARSLRATLKMMVLVRVRNRVNKLTQMRREMITFRRYRDVKKLPLHGFMAMTLLKKESGQYPYNFRYQTFGYVPTYSR